MLSFKKNSQLPALCRGIVDLAEDAVIVIDTAQNVVLFNAAAERIFGYAGSEVLGRPLDLLMPERFHLQHRLHVGDFNAGKSATRGMGERSRQIFGRRRDGSEFIASVQIMRLDGGYFAAILRDVSQTRRTEEELLRLAATDPLTGAFNQREFTALAEREALRAQRYHHPLSLLLFDIDGFKKLNETYGHNAGDRALQRFTALCSNALRNVDIFGRWGGEEFVALLPETAVDGAAVIAERLRKIVNDNIMIYNDKKISFTVTIGVTQYRDGEASIDQPLARADRALQEAKAQGRNKVSVIRG